MSYAITDCKGFDLVSDFTGGNRRRFSLKCFKTLLTLCGVLLTLCSLILGCAMKFLSVWLFWGNFSPLECIKAYFVHFPKNLGPLAFPRISADLFVVAKATILSLRKQEGVNF